jgi:ABC-type Zn uptake system ZnuABC Zn-binding protein ZnuA
MEPAMMRGKPSRIVTLVTLVIPLALLAPLSCTTTTNPWSSAGNKPKVVTSFAPLCCFAKNVAGDDAVVLTLPTKHGPHSYPYDAKDLTVLKGADLFLINGLSLDEVVCGKLKKNCGNDRLKMVKVTDDIPTNQRRQLNVQHGDHTHEGDDPHAWLGIDQAVLIVRKIAQELGDIDPGHRDNYNRNADKTIKKLLTLKQEGRDALKDIPVEERRIVTTHDAFGYFAGTFDVKIVDFIQPQAGQGPDQIDIKKTTDIIKSQRVRLITTEPQYPKKGVEQLYIEMKHELSGQPLPIQIELDPLETASETDLADLDWYEKKMAQNIKNLVTGFKKYGAEK